MENVKENNKLIAEFMGAINENGEYDLFGTTSLNRIFEDIDSNDQFAKHFFKPKEMKFNTSWDWLVPVVKEIRETINVKLTVDDYDTKKDYNQRLNPYEYNIDSIYKGAIEFIKWWNSAVENERDMASDMDREPDY